MRFSKRAAGTSTGTAAPDGAKDVHVREHRRTQVENADDLTKGEGERERNGTIPGGRLTGAPSPSSTMASLASSSSSAGLTRAPTMLEQLLEEINFQRTKELRQMLKDGSYPLPAGVKRCVCLRWVGDDNVCAMR